MNKSTLVKVTNKYNGPVGYTIPDQNIHKNFNPGQSREITFEELEKLFFTPGGKTLLEEYLEIVDESVVEELFGRKSEIEYHYSQDDIRKLMETGSLDQFLDCLDFAPEAVKESIKDIAVDLPLNDVQKREAIKEKLSFDVSKAIEIKNTKTDGESEAEKESTSYGKLEGRRVSQKAPQSAPAATGRRYKPASK